MKCGTLQCLKDKECWFQKYLASECFSFTFITRNHAIVFLLSEIVMNRSGKWNTLMENLIENPGKFQNCEFLKQQCLMLNEAKHKMRSLQPSNLCLTKFQFPFSSKTLFHASRAVESLSMKLFTLFSYEIVSTSPNSLQSFSEAFVTKPTVTPRTSWINRRSREGALPFRMNLLDFQQSTLLATTKTLLNCPTLSS